MSKKSNNRPIARPIFSNPNAQSATGQNISWRPDYEKIANLFNKNEFQFGLPLALALYEKFPKIKEVQNITAVFLMYNHRSEEAIEIWKGIKVKDANIFNNMGRAYQNLKMFAESELNLILALRKEPNHADALLNLAVLYGVIQKQADKALPYYKQVLKLQPDNMIALNNYLFYQNYRVPPNPEEFLADSKRLARLYLNNVKISPAKKPTNPNKPLHIGLLSTDLRKNPVGYFLEGILRSQAVKQFTWSAYAITRTYDDLSERIRPLFKNWHKDLNTWSDERIIELIRQDEVDILIDLSGYTGENRMSIFATQATPVQITWLGYWGTTGLPTMQAVIADPYCVHEGEEKWFTETVYKMPHTRLCMTPPTADVAVNSLPVLTKHEVTIGCFQNPIKLNDSVLLLWSKVAKLLPDAQWRFQNESLVEGRAEYNIFLQRLLKLGFNRNNLHFYGKTSRDDYLVAYNEVDFILDTFAYTGGTTTVEALWMGVPTITLTYPGMLARQGEQLLSVAGLTDWVCHTEQEYLDRALYWANPENYTKLNALRLSLRENVLASPLFATEQFGEDWCKVVRQIWVDECQKP